MRVLLLNPPFYNSVIREGRCQSGVNTRQTPIPQMSLAYIGGLLEREKAEVRLEDCIALKKDLTSLVCSVKSYKPQLIVVNTATPTIDNDMLVIEKLKRVNPDSVTCVFGAHVTALHEDIIRKHPYVDVVIRREPELTILELYHKISQYEHFLDVPGISARLNGKLFITENRAFEENIDNFGWPARHLLPNNRYIHPIMNKRFTIVNVSRGCPERCSFCVASLYYGDKIRKRSIENILDELELDAIKKHKIRHIWFYADNFMIDEQFVSKLCEGIIRRKLDIIWWSNAFARIHNEGLFKLMKRSGCYMLSLGAESGDQDILDNAGKNITLGDTARIVNFLGAAGIYSLVYFIIGLPGETRESIKKTLEFAKKIKPDFLEFYPAVPYPGTKFYDIMKAQNLITNFDWSLYENNGKKFAIRTRDASSIELEGILKWMYRSFYYRLTYIMEICGKAHSPFKFVRLFRFGINYLKKLILG